MLSRRSILFRYLISALSLIVVFLAAGALQPCLAQVTTGNLVGQVRNQAGAGLPEVKVLAINARNGHKAATRTDENGGFTIYNLSPGAYHIVASKDKYQTLCIPELPVFLNKNNSVKYPPNIRLPAAAGVNPTCQGLKIANLNQHDDKTSANDLVADNDDFTDPLRGGPRAPSFAISITLERETNPDSSQSAPTPQKAASRQTPSGEDAIGVVNTIDATRSSNVTDRQLASLPLGGATYMRTFDDLALLSAGVAPPPYTPGVRGPGVGFGIGTAGQFSVNGARARSNNFSVDGSDTNDPDVGVRRGGYVAQVPLSIEATNEFSISTLLWGAELGRKVGSQVNAVSKYGGNDYHGQVYGFFTDSRLNARNFFDYTGGVSGSEDPFTRTQAGVAIGGPIIKDRTQFFAGVEGAKINASTEQHFSSPRKDERFGLGPTKNEFIISPIPYIFLNSSVVDGTQGVTTLGSDILSYYPLPNNPGGPYGPNTYSRILPADGKGVISSFRLSHLLAENNQLNVQYSLTDDERILPSINRAIQSTIGSDARSQFVSLILTSQLTPRLANLARFSFGRTRVDFPEHPFGPLILPTKSSVGKYLISNSGQLNSYINGNSYQTLVERIGELHIEPFSPVGVNTLLFPQGRVNNTFQFAELLSWNRRQHSLKFGGDIRRVQLNSFQDRLYRPQVNFSYGGVVIDNKFERVTGAQLAALPFPSSTLQTLTIDQPNSHIGLRITEYNFFFNDNWRVRSNLVLDYGVRYEYNTVPHEVNNKIENALALKNLPTSANLAGDDKLRYEDIVDKYRKVLGGRTGIYDPDRNNFGPHFGFAWDPWSDGKSSIRAGYGIYFDGILGAVVSQSRNVFPNELPISIGQVRGVGDVNLTLPCNLRRFQCLAPNQINSSPANLAGDILNLLFPPTPFPLYPIDQFHGLTFTLPAKNLPQPYAQQWHLTLERQWLDNYLISGAYVGARGINLTRLTTPNLGPTIRLGIPLSVLDENSQRHNVITLPDGTCGFILNGVINRQPTCVYLFNNTFLANYNASKSRPTVGLGPYQIFENSAGSTYHALQIEAAKRYAGGVNFTLAYTWSHAIDVVSDLFPIAGAPILAQDQKKPELERGNSNFDLRHRFAASLIWDLPFYRQAKSGVARWLGDWQLASIFQAQAGQPFTLNLPVDANSDGNLSDRLSTTRGLTFSDGHQRQRVAVEQGAKLEDFIQAGGVLGRNIVRGDGFINLDLSLTKTFRFTDGRNLAFRAEFFNLFNRANFGLPIRILDAPSFGSAVDTVNPARIIQFAVKLTF